jgi:hypothetical protein
MRPICQLALQLVARRDWRVVLLQIGSSSASLIGKGGTKRTHNNDHSGLLIDGITKLVKADIPVYFLVHWMEGNISTEPVLVKGEKQLTIDGLLQEIWGIEEDTRYYVIASKQVGSL